VGVRQTSLLEFDDPGLGNDLTEDVALEKAIEESHPLQEDTDSKIWAVYCCLSRHLLFIDFSLDFGPIGVASESYE